MAYAYNPNTWEGEAGESRVQSHPQLFRVQRQPGYVRTCVFKKLWLVVKGERREEDSEC